jgi:hypothetical protein
VVQFSPTGKHSRNFTSQENYTNHYTIPITEEAITTPEIYNNDIIIENNDLALRIKNTTVPVNFKNFKVNRFFCR